MKMEQIQNAQTIFSGNSIVELTDSELATVQGGCSHGYDCQDDWGDWDADSDGSDGNRFYKNSFNKNSFNNNNDNNTNLNLLNGLSLL
ncbi:MAG: hypothetical protein M3Y39_18935 [Chloroflexota bacterium]|nr:hypothetical protein [Chloroflexota bacterium]